MFPLGTGSRLAAFPDGCKRHRQLHPLLDQVILKRAPGRGKNAVPVHERTQIVLRGNLLLEPSPSEVGSRFTS